MRVRFGILACLLLALAALAPLAGCGKKSAAPPTAPAPLPPPPQVSTVFPAPRSVFVDYFTGIWADFAEALDPTTISTQNIYLKVDTVRKPISLSWDAVNRRLYIQPATALALNTTYTVEFSPNLAAADGTPLGATYWWQFTTTSIRHPASPFPADRGVQSPFTTLGFGGNETTPGPLTYEIYAGPDSSLIAARGVPFLYRGTKTLYTPTLRWREHGPTFWSITVENASTSERSNGAVWRFDTPGADAPIDSVDVDLAEWGYRVPGFFGGCLGTELITGRGDFSGISWQVSFQPQDMKLAGLRMELSATAAYQDSLPGLASVWFTTAPVRCANGLVATTDASSGRLANGVPVGLRTVRFDSDTLDIYVQQALRLRALFGYRYQSVNLIHWVAPRAAEVAFVPMFRLYFFTGNGTIGPGPARPAAAPPGAPAGGRTLAPGGAAVRSDLSRFSRLTRGPIHR